MLAAADAASHAFGAGPGAVRFIDGTFAPHASLEARIARFVDRPAARIFNSAYTTVLGLAITLSGPTPSGSATRSTTTASSARCASPTCRRRSARSTSTTTWPISRSTSSACPTARAGSIVIFDGIFSMRGDNAPVDAIAALVARHEHRFRDGVVTVMDDSHGIAAYGRTGRGTEEHCGARVDIFVGTFGKAFGVNGGFVAAAPSSSRRCGRKPIPTSTRTRSARRTRPRRSRPSTSPTAPRDARDSRTSQARTTQFRHGLESLGFESIPGPHPVVPLLVRDTGRVRAMVAGLFERGILAVGLTFPVVPKGDETIRFQINAAHTESDIDEVLGVLKELQGPRRPPEGRASPAGHFLYTPRMRSPSAPRQRRPCLPPRSWPPLPLRPASPRRKSSSGSASATTIGSPTTRRSPTTGASSTRNPTA